MTESKGKPTRVEKAVWSTAYVNKLPDAAFAVVLSGGEKDEEDKTVPRKLRKLPHHTSGVKSASENETVDLPHLRNALAREPQTDMPAADHAKAKAHLQRHAKALLEEKETGAYYFSTRIKEALPDADPVKLGAMFERALAGKVVGMSEILASIYMDIERDHTAVEMVVQRYEDGYTDSYERRRPMYYPVNVYSEWVLLGSWDEENGERLWRLPYVVTADEEVQADWDSLTEVRRQVEYIPKASAGFKSVKGADGRWYWIGISGSAYVDRDLEIISRKSLTDAVAYGDETGNRGTLDIYHIPGTDVGDCIAQALVGNFLVEAGVWHDTPLAEKARQWTDEIGGDAGLSVMFSFEPAEKTRGIYNGPIIIHKRSLLRVDDAACPWTAFWGGVKMGGEKGMGTLKDLEQVVGPELAAAIVEQAATTDKALSDLHVAHKEKTAEPDPVQTEADVEEKTAAAGEPEATSEEPVAGGGEKQAGRPEAIEGQFEELTFELDESAAKAIAGHVAEAVAIKLAEANAAIEAKLAEAVAKMLGDVEAVAGRLSEVERGMGTLLEEDHRKVAELAAGRSKWMLRAVGKRPTEQTGKEADVADGDAEANAAKQLNGEADEAGGISTRLKHLGLAGTMQLIQQERARDGANTLA